MLEGAPERSLRRFPSDVVTCVGDLLACRHMVKHYGCTDWFAYKALPPEWVAFCLQADATDAAIQEAALPKPDDAPRKGTRRRAGRAEEE